MGRAGLEKRVAGEMDRLAGGAVVVVGVSGGGDSVALLRLLHEWAGPGRDLVVAHLNHGVRGEQADAEERFVAGLAGGLGRDFESRRWTPTRAGHFEADARRARYGWLAEVAGRRGAGAVAVGHTMEDQAETILHRVVRGTGPEGLAGMAESRELAAGVELVRPLLGCSRGELRAYLREVGQGWAEDPSNDDRTYTRARIRHELIPALQGSFNPKVVEALTRLGKLVRAERRALEATLARLEREIGREGAGIVMDRGGLLALGDAERRALLRRAWRRRGWPEREMSEGRWGRLARFLAGGEGRMDVGGGIEAVVERDRVTIAPTAAARARPEPPGPRELPVPGGVEWGAGRIETWLPRAGREPEGGEEIDRDRVEGALWVGPPLEAERFDPLGMGGKTQPLADFLRGRKVPRADRPGVPVVRDQVGIVWVAGHRIAHRVRRTATTRDVLGLRWSREDSA